VFVLYFFAVAPIAESFNSVSFECDGCSAAYGVAARSGCTIYSFLERRDLEFVSGMDESYKLSMKFIRSPARVPKRLPPSHAAGTR